MINLSPALQYIQSKGWAYKPSGDDKVELETCPFCKKTNYGHFYLVISNNQRDGLFQCHRCGKAGNLITLKEAMGDKIAHVDSRSDWSSKERKAEEMPNVEEMHNALLENEEAMDYLVNERGFSKEIIKQRKLGYVSKRYFRECGEVPAIVYPYLVQGNCVFVHYRTLPPSPKAFSSLRGWEAPLYNGEIIKEGLKEIVFVEGEANVIAALDKGIENIVGVPGANFKKAPWLEILDQLNIEKVYICYDKDKVGQKAAQVLASRIGIDKCYKIVLPDFTVPIDGGTKSGKDINEWILHGGGDAKQFEQLKQEAGQFDVQGVNNTSTALDELEEQMNGRSSLAPKYGTPWPVLNKKIGFEDGDVIDIVAPEKVGKTTLAMNIMEYVVDKYNEDAVIICLEMPVVRLARKWVSHVTNTDDSIPKDDTDATTKLENMKNAIALARKKVANRDSDLYFCYPQIKDIDDVYKLIIDCIRRYGVKWVMVDNLQLICDRTLKGSQNRTIHLSQISKTLAGITKDYGIKMIRILQPHRIKDGAMVSTDDVDGASQIAKDCDCMFTADRNKVGEMSRDAFESAGYVEEDVAFSPKMKVGIGLSRYSCGGYVTLEFDGATSTVREYGEADKLKMLANKPPMNYELPKEKIVDTTKDILKKEEKEAEIVL